jgi:uncharacterized membrane protein YheB (UPF0754 family)
MKYDDLELQQQSECKAQPAESKKEEKEEENFLIPAHPPSGWRKYLNLGDISNACTFFIMVSGILLKHYLDNIFSRFVLAFGLFGFAGGITNWLAVKMLFDRIPFLLGSGVIPRQFKEIRKAIKDAVLQMFFDKSFLESYLGPRSRELLKSLDLAKILKDTMNDPDFDQMFIEKLTDIANRPEGMMLQTMATMFGGVELMAPTLKPMLVSFGQEMVSSLVDRFDAMKVLSVDKIRDELDILMEKKLLQLTPERVKEIMEGVIRNHLGWLVLWGNVFGGMIGIISMLAGYEGS